MSKPYRGPLSIMERLDQNTPLPSMNRIAQDRRDALAEIERLRTAIKWALGEGVDTDGKGFGQVLPETEPLPRFWWRTQLRRMAGMGGNLSYDKERRTIIRGATTHG